MVLGALRPLLSDPVDDPATATGGPRRCAVLGSPITHSLSPALHRAAYAHLGLDWTYDAVEVAEAGLPAFLAGLTGPDGGDAGWRGLSLTMPLKRAVLPLLDSVEPLAALVGAANTVVVDRSRLDRSRLQGSRLQGSRLEGSNTDVPGLVAALVEGGVGLSPDARVLILGAGATAASTVAAVAELARPAHRAQLVLAVRESARAAPLVALAGEVGLAVEVVDLRSLPDRAAPASGQVELVVSTVPAGAVGPELAGAVVRACVAGGALCDVVYDGWPTPLALAGAAAGLAVVSGADLLVHQARGQVVAFTGRPVPVEVLRGALPDRLREPMTAPAHHSST